jgi:hypothetical protein
MRSLKLIANSVFYEKIETDYYHINDLFVLNNSEIEIDPNTNEKMITGKGKIVNIISGSVAICCDSEEEIDILPINKVHTV